MGTLIITPEKVIEISIENKEFLPKKIKDAKIESSQLKYIKPIVTPALYNRITQEIADENISADIEFLLNEFILKALAYYVKHSIIPDTFLQITNMGGQKPNTEYSTHTNNGEMNKLLSHTLDTANIYMNEFTDYMGNTKNATDLQQKYPEYEKYANVKNRIKKRGGIVFSSKRNNYNN